MNKNWEKEFDGFYNKMESVIMENIYTLIDLNFGETLIADATTTIPFREELKSFISQNLVFQKKEILEKIQKDLDAGKFGRICSNETTFKDYIRKQL